MRPLIPAVLALVLPAAARAASGLEDPGFPQRVVSLLETVRARHVSPLPTRELLVAGVAGLEEHVGPGWVARVPEVREPEDALAFLERLAAVASATEEQDLARALAQGLLAALPGGAFLLDEESARVTESLAGNRYEGVGVVLDFRDGRPRILDTYHGGPAHRAGIEPGSVVYEVDGVDTAGLGPGDFIAYSRDEVGTELEYVVGAPGSSERRTVRLVRTVVPRETVLGVSRGTDERWDFALPDARRAHVRVVGLEASTPHELRRAAERIRAAGPEGVVLDLRGCRSTNRHAAELVADLFLAEGTLAVSETRAHRREVRAGPDTSFDPSGAVVLVDGETRGAAEWLAVVLRRAGSLLVGAETAGDPFLPATVEVPGWTLRVRLATGWLVDPAVGGPLRSPWPDVPCDPATALEVALASLRRSAER